MTDTSTPATPKTPTVPLSVEYINFINAKYNLGIVVFPKRDSKLMKLIGPILRIFNKKFNTYYTTIGKTMYVPDSALSPDADQVSLTETFMHESRHRWDEKRYGLLGIPYKLAYLFPQSLALLTLLSFGALSGNKLWLLNLLWLVCLAPIPAFFRMVLEVRAYKTSTMLAHHLYDISSLDQQAFIRDRVTHELTSGQYYWCWPFASQIDKRMQDQTFMSEEPYTAMKEFVDLKMLPKK